MAELLRGVDYGPFRDDQDPRNQDFPTEAELASDLTLLAQMAGAVRLYTVANGFDYVITHAAAFGLKTIPSAYLNPLSQSWGPAANALEIDSLVDVLGRTDLANIPFVVVGNEAIRFQGFDAAGLISELQQVRACLPAGVKLTTSETSQTYLDHPELAGAVDLIFVNIHPYWEHQAATSIDDAVAYVMAKVAQLKAAFPTKPVVISEVGWPTAGPALGALAPSAANAQLFWDAFVVAAKAAGVDYFAFEGFDEPWKEAFGPVESHWGLYDNERHAKWPGASIDPWISGTAGADLMDQGPASGRWLEGLAGADRLLGAAGVDRLFGDEGDDTLVGAAGDDLLYGGSDVDVAQFTGPSAGYAWSTSGDFWLVQDGRAGAPDGHDRLSGVEVLKFADQSWLLAPIPALAALKVACANLLRLDPEASASLAWLQPLAASVTGGAATLAAAVQDVVARADASTSVATMSYAFFTGKVPSGAGVDYLVNPTGPNPNNLNSAYYQSFNVENRYINFAVNLGKAGEGAASFAAQYGGLSLLDTTKAVYGLIFGAAPTDAKAHALIDTRTDYFAYYGGDGAAGIGTKAAMVGWLLAEAAKANLGVYALSNDGFLTDLADGAAFAVDLVGVYGRPEYVYLGP